jgi:hypothetical protein
VSDRWRWLGRVLCAIVLVMVLGGPGPGSVGSCSETEKTFAEARQYCIYRDEAIARRVRQRCINAGMDGSVCNPPYQMVYENLEANCAAASWPLDCSPPRQAEADACIEALLDMSTLELPDDMVPGCDLSCAARGMLLAPADASVPWTDGSTEVP